MSNPTVWFKQGVIGALKMKAQKGLGKVAKLYFSHGRSLYITAVRDGNHMPGSFHYIGMAFDFRKAEGITIEMIRKALGKNYDVVEHSTHFHVEYDPK